MVTLKELVSRAQELKEKGFTTPEIADELNVSEETALWLIMRDTEEALEEVAPKDIFVDWSSIGSSPARLRDLANAMTDLLVECLQENNLENPEVVIGIATSGIPLATVVAENMGAALTIVRPRRHVEEKATLGTISQSFAAVEGKKVAIVDDVITTGETTKETIDLLREKGADPLAVVILIDKKGIEMISEVPVRALIKLGRVDVLS